MIETAPAGAAPVGSVAPPTAPPRPASRSRLWAGGLSVTAMCLLIAVIARPRRDDVPQGHIDPQVWWHVGRASGLIAWALLGLSVAGGMSLSTSLAGRRIRSWTTGVHTFIGVLAVMFTALHLFAVLSSDELRIGWLQLVVPFTRASAPLAQASGVLAWYLLLAVAVTSWLRGLLPWRWWRRLHLLSFPLFGSACAHAVLAGSDASHPVLLGLSAAAGLVLIALFGYRLYRLRRHRSGRAARPAAASTDPVAGGSIAASGALALETSAPVHAAGTLQLVVVQTSWEAEGVVALVLADPAGSQLPEWEPGAHLELALPSGRVRHYSLFGDPADRSRYHIAVLRQDDGRGGSKEVHVGLPVGTRLAVGPPRNNFRLGPAPAYLFVAGGIGITGVLPMAEAVAAAAGEWRFLYGGRTRASMAFIDRVERLGADRVDIAPQDECGLLDLRSVIDEQPAGTAVYCCGPPPLLAAVAEMVAARPDLELHVERFTGSEARGGDRVLVELRRSELSVEVGEHETVLGAVRRVLPSVPASCEQGVCGSCRVTVVEGLPDHRDELLSDAERACGQMLICVSRAKGERLVIDL